MRALLLFAALMPLAGCWILVPCGGGDFECPPPTPIGDSLWEVTESSRTELVDGVVEVSADTVIVEYVDDQGQTWEVEYAVVERFPE